jgi:hypothetical protein
VTLLWLVFHWNDLFFHILYRSTSFPLSLFRIDLFVTVPVRPGPAIVDEKLHCVDGQLPLVGHLRANARTERKEKNQGILKLVFVFQICSEIYPHLSRNKREKKTQKNAHPGGLWNNNFVIILPTI